MVKSALSETSFARPLSDGSTQSIKNGSRVGNSKVVLPRPLVWGGTSAKKGLVRWFYTCTR